MGEIIIVVSGIILFLIGMVHLSSAVQKLINVRIKEYIKYAVEKPLYGLFTGVISTIIFQSSSASTALTVGLVSAGLISFYSSLAIILGSRYRHYLDCAICHLAVYGNFTAFYFPGRSFVVNRQGQMEDYRRDDFLFRP